MWKGVMWKGVTWKENEQEREEYVLKYDPIQKYKNKVNDFVYKYLDPERTWIFRAVCEQYLGDKGFSLGGGSETMWENRVEGLTYSSPVKTFLKSALLDKTLDTLSTGSGYDYSDKEAKDLSGGKIIASFEENKSLMLGDSGVWELAVDDSKIQSLREALLKTYKIKQKEQPSSGEENIIKEGEQLNK